MKMLIIAAFLMLACKPHKTGDKWLQCNCIEGEMQDINVPFTYIDGTGSVQTMLIPSTQYVCYVETCDSVIMDNKGRIIKIKY